MTADAEDPRMRLELPAPAASSNGFSARFVPVGGCEERENGRVRVQFFRLTSANLATLAEFLHYKLPHFCLPRHEVVEALEASSQTDLAPMVRLLTKARNLLITARKQQKRSGEPAELMLFLFLEAVARAPRIACKLALKTSANMPVHGSDAIHARLEEGHLKVIWGEAKLYVALPDSLKKLTESLEGFVTPADETGVSPRDRDIEIIQEHLEVADPEMRKLLLDYFDPYTDSSNNLRQGFGCLIAFEVSCYSEGELAAEDWCKQNAHRLIDQLLDCLPSAVASFDVEVFLLPVPSVMQLRSQFFSRLGLNDD